MANTKKQRYPYSLHATWMPAVVIGNYPQYHSTAMDTKMMLLAIPERDDAVRGWYLGGLIQEFRMEGSPSTFNPTYWMPIPEMPPDYNK
jgi:hypothetical protein